MRNVLLIGAGIAAGYVIRGKLERKLIGKDRMQEALVEGLVEKIDRFTYGELGNPHKPKKSNVSYAERARRSASCVSN